MNNQYIQYPLKWSLKPCKSISVFRALFGRKHQTTFCNVLHKLYKLCVTHGHDKYFIPGSRKFLSFFHRNSIWICWNAGLKIASDFQTSSPHNCLGEIAQTATKRLSGRWRKSATGNYGSAVTLYLGDRGCILKATKFSDVVWCFRSSKMLKYFPEVSIIILVDIEFVTAGFLVFSTTIRNRNRESRFL